MGNDLRLATVLTCDGNYVTSRTGSGIILAGPHLSGYQPQPGDLVVLKRHFDGWVAIGRVRTEPDGATS